jgi:catechol 2,3-dioxygenase-like lactoylglutathione lyase family enzyme
MQFDHINIRCRDQEAVRDFLVAIVGVEQGYRPAFDFPGYWLYLDGRPIIHTQSTDRSPTDSPEGWADHIAFGPCDFDTALARIEASGYEHFVGGIPETGVRQIFATGPEGIKVELQCPPGAAG